MREATEPLFLPERAGAHDELLARFATELERLGFECLLPDQAGTPSMRILPDLCVLPGERWFDMKAPRGPNLAINRARFIAFQDSHPNLRYVWLGAAGWHSATAETLLDVRVRPRGGAGADEWTWTAGADARRWFYCFDIRQLELRDLGDPFAIRPHGMVSSA